MKSCGSLSPASRGTKPVTTMTQAAKHRTTCMVIDTSIVERCKGFMSRDRREKK